MEDVSIGYCNGCDKPVVYLKWVDDEVKIVVGCKDCGHEVMFDLEELYGTLIGEDETEEEKQVRMLAEFVLKGKPN